MGNVLRPMTAILLSLALVGAATAQGKLQEVKPPKGSAPVGTIAPQGPGKVTATPNLRPPKPARIRIGPAERTNDVSGEARAEFNQAEARGGVAAMVNRFYLKEKSDNPCEFNINQTSWAYDPAQGSGTVYRFLDQPEQPLHWAMWGGCDRDRDAVGAGPGGKIEIVPADGDYITDLRVCTNSSNNDRGRLVKGFEVKTARIRPNGTLKASRSYKDEQPNCSQWKRWSNCPSGALASSIIIHYAFGIENGMKSIVGLELECMAVEKTTDY